MISHRVESEEDLSYVAFNTQSGGARLDQRGSLESDEARVPIRLNPPVPWATQSLTVRRPMELRVVIWRGLDSIQDLAAHAHPRTRAWCLNRMSHSAAPK